MADSKFDAAWWNIWEMRRQANQIADEGGVMERGKFRHAYTSAKTADRTDGPNDIWFREGRNPVKAVFERMFKTNTGWDLNNGKTISRGLGIGNELFGADFVEDTKSNEIGLIVRDEVDREVAQMRREMNLSDTEVEELRERLLRNRIAEAIKQGRFK